MASHETDDGLGHRCFDLRNLRRNLHRRRAPDLVIADGQCHPNATTRMTILAMLAADDATSAEALVGQTDSTISARMRTS